MVKQEEIITEAGGGGGGRGFMDDMLGLGEADAADYLLCLSPSSSYLPSPAASTTTAAAASPTCTASHLAPPPYHHHVLSFGGPEQQYHGDGHGLFGFQYCGGAQAIPVVVPQRCSPTTECSSSSLSSVSMSSSPTATAISRSKPQAFKKKGSRGGDQRKAAPAADAVVAAAAATNKRPRVRKERLGERIIALQQLVSPFGKSDTASVLHEALGYIRFLHDQVQVLSSPYMQRLPPSARLPAEESAAGVAVAVAEPRASDLRSRGLCLVPVSCTDLGHGNGNGADLWSVAAGMAMVNAATDGSKQGGAALLRADCPGRQLA